VKFGNFSLEKSASVDYGDLGWQIFLDKTYKKGGNTPNDHKVYQISLLYYIIRPYCLEIFQMAVKFTNISHLETLSNIPKLV
jgi:hypothetical protein